MALPLKIDYFLARHRTDADGLSCWTCFSGRKRMAWSDARDVRFAAAKKWFRLRDGSGSTARISFMLMGLPEFARLLLAHAPPQATRLRRGDV
jgi:Bacterial PH domain